MSPDDVSEQFRRISGRIYAFATVALAIRFLPIEAITVSGARVDISDSDPIIGILGWLVAVLTLAGFLVLMKDWILAVVRDDNHNDSQVEYDAADFKKPRHGTTFLERHFRIAMLFSRIAVFIETGTPILFGSLTSFAVSQEMLSLWRAVT